MTTANASASQYTRSSPGIHMHRAASGNYTRIPNELLRDSRLTPAELGVLCRLLSNADGWHETTETLAPKMGVSHDTMKRIWRGLDAKGYVRRRKYQDEAGHIRTEIHVYDTPQDDVVKPYRERGPVATDGGKNRLRSELGELAFSQVAPMAGKPMFGETAAYKNNHHKNEQQKGRSADAALPDEPHIVVEEAPRKTEKVTCRACGKTAQDCYENSHTCPQKWFCDRCGDECYMTICDKCDGSPWASEFGSDKEKAA